jgi:hypothetical protein
VPGKCRILKRVRKHGDGGLQMAEVQKLQNSRSIEMLITHIDTMSRAIKNVGCPGVDTLKRRRSF